MNNGCRKKVSLIAAWTVVMALSGCAPSIGSDISLSKIPDREVDALHDLSLKQLTVRVDKFDDERTIPWVVEIDGSKKISSENDAGREVQLAFERFLRLNGVRISQSAPLTIAGSVHQWLASVSREFLTSEARGEAILDVHLLDKNNNLIYSGTYTGNVVKRHPLVLGEVEHLLGDVMGMTIAEALGDEKLVRTMHEVVLTR